MTGKPLAGIRVLDLSRILAGPWAGQLLADLGAEVIKVERPRQGDDTRHWGPPWLKDADGRETSTATYYLAANRGKQSITVNLQSRRGQDIVRRLACQSDVLIENFRAGQMRRFGLDHETLLKARPGLVYCSITGFGHTGPLSERPGYDLLIQGMGGLMSITGDADGPPQKVGVAVADLAAGLYATVAIQGALLERERSGLGQHIDLALLDVQVALLANQAMNYLAGGVVPHRRGNAHPNIVPYEVFEAADGHFILAVGNDRQFARLADVIGKPDLARDKRFRTNAARVDNRDTLVPLLTTAFKTQPGETWLARLEAASIPAGRINNISEVYDLEQVKQRGMLTETAHPEAGSLPLGASPIRYSRSTGDPAGAPPLLGADTETVLARLLDYDPGTLAALRRDDVI